MVLQAKSKSYRRKLNKYDRQFIAENTARWAPEAKRRRNDDTQDGAPPGSVFHAHTSIDVTQRDRHSVKTSYFRAPQAISLPHVVSPAPTPSGLSEALNFDMVDEAYVDFLADTTTDMEPIKSKRKRTAGVSRLFCVCILLTMFKDEPLKLWIPEQEKFLREFIRLEGRGDAMLYQTCQGLPGCPNEAVIRCRDCEGLQLYCQGCTVVQHIATPLHVMEVSFLDLYFCFALFTLLRYGWAPISSVSHSVTLAYVFNLAILLESSVVIQPLHSTTISLYSRSTVYTVSPWISVTALQRKLMIFSYCALAGTRQPLQIHGPLLLSAF